MELVIVPSINPRQTHHDIIPNTTAKSDSEHNQNDINGHPFQKHDIHEWSRLDAITGMMEHARVQRDQWTANSANSTHQYGKVVDSRNRSAANGDIQQCQQKQLEVFQTQTFTDGGCSLQVIRTQTVTSSKSHHRISTSSSNSINNNNNNVLFNSRSLLDSIANKLVINGDDNTLKYASSSVQSNDKINKIDEDFEQLQLTVNPLDLSSQKSKASVGRSGSIGGRRPPSRPRNKNYNNNNNIVVSEKTQEKCTDANNSEKLHREFEFNKLKSNSNENLHIEKDENTQHIIDDWKRLAKIRRSLQIQSSNGSLVNKIKQDLENGRRLNTAFSGTNVDLQALDQILQSVRPSQFDTNVNNSSANCELDNSTTQNLKQGSKLVKRNSFVTAESLQEVRGRLRKLNKSVKIEDSDDGIVAEDRVMADIRNKTGSLESRTSNKSNANTTRTDDWYNRRKSYGFEQMHCPHNELQSRMESSTDSGIYRSTETCAQPTLKSTIVNLNDPFSSKQAQEELANVWSRLASKNDEDRESVTIRIPITTDTNTSQIQIHQNCDTDLKKRHSIAVDESKYINNTKSLNSRRTSLAIPIDSKLDTDVNNSNSNARRTAKKVEFCKTEVHFAAESGRVNIVETDEKPPPTQNYRRRRRQHNSTTSTGIYDLPLTHFGDTSYEQKLFSDVDEKYPKEKYVSTTHLRCSSDDENENTRRGILKNKPIKPKPYHLGENLELDNDINGSSPPWGVKLRSIHQLDDTAKTSPMWNSTVTVKNTTYPPNNNNNDNLNKFQMEFKQFRTTNEIDNNCSSSWSVADRIKYLQEFNQENKQNLSTKINVCEQPPINLNKVSTPISSNSTLSSRPLIINNEHLIKESTNDYNKIQQNNNLNTSQLKKENEGLFKFNNHIPTKFNTKSTNLNSPALVGGHQNYINANNKTFEQSLRHYENSQTRNSTSIKNLNLQNRKAQQSTLTSSAITRLRPVPTNFSAIRSPRTPRKYSERINVVEKRDDSPENLIYLKKPDLLCHINNSCLNEVKEEENPIYENIKTMSESIESETAILDELTRAADQILQAVNGYTDEESIKISTEDDEDDTNRRKKGQYQRKTADILGTISETKSWSSAKIKTKSSSEKHPIKPARNSDRYVNTRTSSTSSTESINQSHRLNHTNSEKKKLSNESFVKTTKARRLQRASSREALLQTHGSSSEDITTPNPIVRKPRTSRRSKTSTTNSDISNQNTKKVISNYYTPKPVLGSKKDLVNTVKSDKSNSSTNLPEIRHKTVVGTIRSSSERQMDKTKSKKVENIKKRTLNTNSINNKSDISSKTRNSGRINNTFYRNSINKTNNNTSLIYSEHNGLEPNRRLSSQYGSVVPCKKTSNRNEALNRHLN